MAVAIPLFVSCRRGHCARVIRVWVAREPAAGRRCPALVHRIVGAILVRDSAPLENVHAKRKGRIISLSPGRFGCQNRPDCQNRHSQNTHRSLPRELMGSASAQGSRQSTLIQVNSRLLGEPAPAEASPIWRRASAGWRSTRRSCSMPFSPKLSRHGDAVEPAVPATPLRPRNTGWHRMYRGREPMPCIGPSWCSCNPHSRIPQPDNLQAKRKSRIIFLRLGRPGRQNHPDRQECQSRNAHPEPPRC